MSRFNNLSLYVLSIILLTASASFASGQESNWESRWQGTYSNPSGTVTDRVTMDLKKVGHNLSGTILYHYDSGTDGPHELNGRISNNGSFILTETRGVLWKGRFSSRDQIDGVRPNGPANEPNIPMWPFTLKRANALSSVTAVENQEGKPRIGIVRSTPYISSGCNCTLQLPADYRAQNLH